MSSESQQAKVINQVNSFCNQLYQSREIKGYKVQIKDNNYGNAIEILLTLDYSIENKAAETDTITT